MSFPGMHSNMQTTCEVCGKRFSLLDGSILADRKDGDAWKIGCVECSNEWNYWINIGPWGAERRYLTRGPKTALRWTAHVSPKRWFSAESFLGCIQRLNCLLPDGMKIQDLAGAIGSEEYEFIGLPEDPPAPIDSPPPRNPRPVVREAMSLRLRFSVMERDGFACRYCGASGHGVKLHVDHVLAVANGGTNASDNLVTACRDCNLGKGARRLVPTQPGARA